MLKKTLLSASVIVLMLIACSSSETSQTDTPQKSFLWEARSGTGHVYILGSIHLASEDIYPLADSIENAFDQSPNLAVEFDITTIDQVQIATLLLQKAKYPRGESLYTNIPNELYQKADAILEDLGADILLFNTYEPWVAAMEIEALQLVNYGYSPENGIDMHLLNRAHEDGKQIHDLESADLQIDLLDGLSEEIQIFILENVVEDPATKKDYEQLFESWEDGDTREMERLVFEEAEEDPEMKLFNEKFLDERNFKMVEKIEAFLEDDEVYFVVVGAAHLVGENGIMNLLKAKGFELTQL